MASPNPCHGDFHLPTDVDDHRTIDMAKGMVLIIGRFESSLRDILGPRYRELIQFYFVQTDNTKKRQTEDNEDHQLDRENFNDGREKQVVTTPDPSVAGPEVEDETGSSSKKLAMRNTMIKVRKSLAPYIGMATENGSEDLAVVLGSEESNLFRCLKILQDSMDLFVETLRRLYGDNYKQAIMRQWTLELGMEEKTRTTESKSKDDDDAASAEEEVIEEKPRPKRRRKMSR